MEGKSNCPQEKEVCLIPPQTKNGGKNPQPFSPFRNSPTRFLMCPPTRLQLANRLETAETFSLGERHLPKGRRGVRGTSAGGIWSRVARWI